MFLTLFLKECRQMLKCLTYYLIVICMVLMYTSQLSSEGVMKKPEPGQKEYGFAVSEDKSVIMKETIFMLAREYTANSYTTYPFSFYKKVTLSKIKQSKVGDILAEITGISKEEINSILKDYYSTVYYDSSKGEKAPGSNSQEEGKAIVVEPKELSITVVSGMNYEHFTELMTKVDNLLGGESSYAEDNLQGNAYVPMTYEQALEEYNGIIKNDHYTGAYARLFCDYLGIILAILPVFMAVTRGLRDRRAKANEIIYVRKASSIQIILSRYFAMIVMLLLPVIILASFQVMDCISIANRMDIRIDPLAHVKYISGWLLPTLLVTTSVGVLITELTDSAIAIIIQGIWWFLSVISGKLVGNYGWNLVPRHNTLTEYDVFKENFNQLVINRVSYTLAAILLLAAAVFVYERKRKGCVTIRGKIFSNRKIKPEA